MNDAKYIGLDVHQATISVATAIPELHQAMGRPELLVQSLFPGSRLWAKGKTAGGH
jgi:hypothetical protein